MLERSFQLVETPPHFVYLLPFARGLRSRPSLILTDHLIAFHKSSPNELTNGFAESLFIVGSWLQNFQRCINAACSVRIWSV
jgi:hypothetical protein